MQDAPFYLEGVRLAHGLSFLVLMRPWSQTCSRPRQINGTVRYVWFTCLFGAAPTEECLITWCYACACRVVGSRVTRPGCPTSRLCALVRGFACEVLSARIFRVQLSVISCLRQKTRFASFAFLKSLSNSTTTELADSIFCTQTGNQTKHILQSRNWLFSQSASTLWLS